jgi:Tfp pilus assembly protein PilF
VLVVAITVTLLIGAVVVLWGIAERSAESAAESGRAALDRQDFAQAVQFLEQAVRRDPQLVSAWKLLAEERDYAKVAPKPKPLSPAALNTD